VATGIDARKVLETGILPVINTAIAHKEPGIGMIGAGITYPPPECFEKALVGGTVEEAVAYTREMGEITTTENPNVTIPSLAFQGLPTGIDVRKVMDTGILPIINTAIAHRDAGIGMIGAGITHPPIEAFQKAIRALAASV
jgi:hypothetical protein